jgi:diphthine methyl ester synthase
MLYMVGIGLGDEKDITLNGLEAIKSCKYVYLENYTSILSVSNKKLEKIYGKKIVLADREMIEKNSDEILSKAKKENVAFLVIGDVFSATTHIDFLLRAKKEKIKVKTIHNASILGAIGIIGLELYKYGKTTSIPFGNKNVITPINVFKENEKLGLHTLFLLDLDVKNKKFMKTSEACKYLIEKKVSEKKLVIGCSALGGKNQEIKVGTLKELSKFEFKKYPQCLIIPGNLHFIEEEAMELWK